MSTLRGRAVVLCVCVLVGGCAARQGSLSGRFVKQGEPSFSYDLPRSAQPRVVAEPSLEQRREIAAHAMQQSSGRTVETTNTELLKALGNASGSPTTENYRRVASVYRRMGILDRAYDYLTLAIDRARKPSALLEERALIWREWRVPQFGLADAHKAVYLAPDSASAHTTLGQLLYATGDRASARRSFENALALEPTAAYALNNLCYLSILDGYHARAEAECRRALDLAPDMSAARNNLALAYAGTGDIVRARNEFLRAGDAAAAHFNIGIIFMATGEYARAAQAFRLASNARPSLKEAVEQARLAQELARSSRESHEQSGTR